MNFNQIFGYSGLNEHNTYVKVLIKYGILRIGIVCIAFFLSQLKK